MLRRRAVSAGLMAVAAFLIASQAPARRLQTVRRYAAGGWVARVVDDRFTDERRCSVRSRSGAMMYRPGAIGFAMRRPDTLQAIYRIDDGPPRRWQDRYPALISIGVEIDDGGLSDPTGGIVWIPEAELAGARTVRIRIGESGRGRRFALGGAAAMIASMRALGCFAQSPN